MLWTARDGCEGKEDYCVDTSMLQEDGRLVSCYISNSFHQVPVPLSHNSPRNLIIASKAIPHS